MAEIWEYGEGGDPGGGHGTETAGPGGPAGEVLERPFPWPPPEGGSVLGAFGETWKGATFDPARFFAAVPRDGSPGPAVLYYLVVGVLASGAGLFWSQLTWSAFAASGIDTGPPLEPLTSFLFAPLVLLVMLGISAAVVHVLLLLFGGAGHGFGTTARVFCYAYSPMVFAIVPFVGGFVGGIWMLVISIIGLREAHRADAWKPLVAVLLPFVALITMSVLLTFAMIAMGVGMMAI